MQCAFAEGRCGHCVGLAQRNGYLEAADCMIGGGLPYPRGPKYLVALWACYEALEGSVTPEVALQAFMDAAREAGTRSAIARNALEYRILRRRHIQRL